MIRAIRADLCIMCGPVRAVRAVRAVCLCAVCAQAGSSMTSGESPSGSDMSIAQVLISLMGDFAMTFCKGHELWPPSACCSPACLINSVASAYNGINTNVSALCQQVLYASHAYHPNPP